MSNPSRLIKIIRLRDDLVPGFWVVRDENGRTYRVHVDRVSASNTNFWAWTFALEAT